MRCVAPSGVRRGLHCITRLAAESAPIGQSGKSDAVSEQVQPSGRNLCRALSKLLKSRDIVLVYNMARALSWLIFPFMAD
jgi:hypothetical protein